MWPGISFSTYNEGNKKKGSDSLELCWKACGMSVRLTKLTNCFSHTKNYRSNSYLDLKLPCCFITFMYIDV